MTQYDFDKLLEKYLQGVCTPEEELLLDEWANRQITTENATLSEEETKTVKNRLWKRISKSAFPNTPLSIRWFSWVRLGIAASLILLCSIGVWYSGVFGRDKKTAISEKQAGVEMTNTTGKAQIITLNDGSTVNLQPNSTLTFSEKFGDHNRIVYLKGEGFFNVKRDTTKPFYVYAGNLVTKVLGTSFRVKAFENTKTEVTVTSGKVMVYENKQGTVSNPVYLTPNQKVHYLPTQQVVLKPQIVDEPIVIQPIKKAEEFRFKKTPLPAVLNRLKEVYGIDIFIKNKALETCNFTGNLNELELFDQLDLICQSIDATYQKYETAIWIDGEGCN